MSALDITTPDNEEQTLPLASAEDNAFFEDIRRDVQNFEEHERQYQEVILDLEGDHLLEPFQGEYAALHHALVKSHDAESRLMRKSTELESDIQACLNKARQAAKLSSADKNVIKSLQEEIASTQKKAAATGEKKSSIQERITMLKQDILELEQKASDPVEATAQKSALQSLLRMQEAVIKEREAIEGKVTSIRQEVIMRQRRVDEVAALREQNDAELKTVREAIEGKNQEVESEKAVKLRTEDNLRAIRSDLASRNAALLQSSATIAKLTAESAEEKARMRRTVEETDKLSEEYQLLCRQLQHMNSTLQSCNEDNDSLQRQILDLMHDLMQVEKTVEEVHKQRVKEDKLAAALRRRNTVAEAKRVEADQHLTELRHQKQQCEEELGAARQALDRQKLLLQSAHREQDILHDQQTKDDAKRRQQTVWLAEKRNQLQHVDHEVQSYEENRHRQNQGVFRLTEECSKYEERAKAAALQALTAIAEVQQRETKIAEAEGAISDVEGRLKQQQLLLNSVITDRNAYAKHYGKLRLEVVEMGKKFKLILLQIKQMKEEIVRREREIVAEEASISSIMKQKKVIDYQIGKYQQETEKKNVAVDMYREEVRKVGDIVGDASGEVTRQRRKCQSVVNERNLLSDRVVQRSKELVEMYEKVHTQQALLKCGEATYLEHIRNIQELDHGTTLLSQELSRLRDMLRKLPELRLQINNFGKELVKEKVKVRALLDESKRPINLHPIHQLAWSDKDAYELSAKANTLQRELRDRRSELERKEAEIREQEGLYVQAKATVAKQPGPEVADQLSAYQSGLAKKSGQMKAMQSTLTYFREQTELYRKRYDELRDRLSDISSSYAARREEDELRAARSSRLLMSGSEGLSVSIGGEEDATPYEGFIAPPREMVLASGDTGAADDVSES